MKASHLEAELAACDEEMLLADAWKAFDEGLRDRRASEAAEARSLVQVEASDIPDWRAHRADDATAQLERVLIQNWKADLAFLDIGEVKLELEPAQSVTLWVGRSNPMAFLSPRGDEGVRGSLAILHDDEPLLA